MRFRSPANGCATLSPPVLGRRLDGPGRAPRAEAQMADAAPIHPLRQRLIDDMTLRGFIPATQRHTFASCALARPTRAKRQAICARTTRGISCCTCKALAPACQPSMGRRWALRFFLRVTLGRVRRIERIPFLPEAKRIPSVLTREEVSSILAAARRCARECQAFFLARVTHSSPCAMCPPKRGRDGIADPYRDLAHTSSRNFT